MAKRVLLGVTGSIAAYKSAYIIRGLVKSGMEVQVIMTDSARDFIGAITLSTLSKRPVLYRFTDDARSGEWNNHVDLGLWADVLLIAPCSANTMAKMAHGICDNLLMATYLSAKCPTIVSPAMDRDMFLHATTETNLQLLRQQGVDIIEPEHGELASGLEGKGRMAEPESIVSYLSEQLGSEHSLSGKHVLISAGPTHEAIDPVRYLGNRSTGKMGFALAVVALSRGARVTLVSGPVKLIAKEGIERIDVTSAEDMYRVMTAEAEKADIIIMAAAVADYRPTDYSSQKIKKSDGPMSIGLERTKDILSSLSQDRREGQVIIGFALETRSGKENARLKLSKKGLDIVVLNTLEDDGAGFAYDTNKVCVMHKDGREVEFPLKSKSEVSEDIFDQIELVL
jgi:phosphopantothenoylcysteine decarboxylase/phosphopantothenate--cysteine ligase